jgi:hypothetical protein
MKIEIYRLKWPLHNAVWFELAQCLLLHVVLVALRCSASGTLMIRIALCTVGDLYAFI